MSNRPLVSVILASYNHVDFVATAVESILGQSFQDFELLVVDDGSTDGTPELVASISDPRITLVRQEHNRLRQTRNLAIAMAKGRYIAFQNSDDEWLPGKLQAQIDVLLHRQDVAACFTGVELIDHKSRVMKHSWADGVFTTVNRPNTAWLRRFFEQGNCLCITSALVDREKLDGAGLFNGSLIQLSDFDLWVRLAAVGQFHIIEEQLTRMRIVASHRSVSSAQRVLRRAAGLFLPSSLQYRLKNVPGIRSLSCESARQQSALIRASRNVSAPKAGSINRSTFEYAEVLKNFCRPPILGLLPQIFDDGMPDTLDTASVQKAWLARYAWSRHTPAHHVFANRIMASLIENDTDRQEITAVFGAEIVREFVHRRGELSLVFQRDE